MVHFSHNPKKNKRPHRQAVLPTRNEGKEQAVSAAGAYEPRLEPDKSRPTARFDDPVLRHHTLRINHVGLCAYLVALAAWQRGLKVAFHYDVSEKSDRFRHHEGKGHMGELFSISDGGRTHFFRRTLGDKTTIQSSAWAENKQQAKAIWTERGLDVPDGVQISRQTPKAVNKFLSCHQQGQRFLLKPVDGTLGQGVYRNIRPEEIHPLLQRTNGQIYLLEEYIAGPQYRVNIVGDRYIAAFENRPPQVVGDGRSTIAQLVAQARRRVAQQVPAVLADKGPSLTPPVLQFLAQRDLEPSSVPMANQVVVLWPEADLDHGAEAVNCTDTLPHPVREICVRAAQALALPVTGIDVIVNPDTGRIVLLEANQVPMIRATAFPFEGRGEGNRMAEAIVDHYFPESVNNHRHTQASFDFMHICRILQSGVASEIAPPVLGPDWVHQRKNIPAVCVDDSTIRNIKQAMFRYGVHANFVRTDLGDLIVDWVAPTARSKHFSKALEGET